MDISTVTTDLEGYKGKLQTASREFMTRVHDIPRGIG
jgi:hypothetical protein